MKNYNEIYKAAYEVYRTSEDQASKDILNKLTKPELLEMVKELDVYGVNKNATKNKIIEDIIFICMHTDKVHECIWSVDIK